MAAKKTVAEKEAEQLAKSEAAAKAREDEAIESGSIPDDSGEDAGEPVVEPTPEVEDLFEEPDDLDIAKAKYPKAKVSRNANGFIVVES